MPAVVLLVTCQVGKTILARKIYGKITSLKYLT